MNYYLIIKINMNLKQFLKEVWWSESDIISYEWSEALMKVRQDWYALRYVKEQTEEICLAAVNQNWNAIKYVKEQTEKICLAAVDQSWDALQYVKEKTEEICLVAVKQDKYALRYVDKSIFRDDIVELTIDQIEDILWYKIKIIGKDIIEIKKELDEMWINIF